jgi:hypothetical protein
MRQYIIIALIVCFVAISYIAQEENKKEEYYECWDGETHWYAPIFHLMEMADPDTWKALEEARQKEAEQEQELNARDN